MRLQRRHEESVTEPQPQASEVCETPKPQATDSIAPTEFSKLRSAMRSIRLLNRSLHRYIRPSEREEFLLELPRAFLAK
jgi:hypothetical protein